MKPTVEQLLILVDRAERGPLSAEEVAVLRAGIANLDAARRSAGGLQRALHDARARLARIDDRAA
ncbi:hypothetical protein AB0O20_06660 [Streptomyces kronopolitis]|uniref:hypothetical protein n=1 Tax=Streptomyces kronopolitis TaxID=1612435 RepID=UPI003430E735